MTYALTAEQMQQVRGALRDALYAVPTDSEVVGKLNGALDDLDAAMQAPEATAGGDVREALVRRGTLTQKELEELGFWGRACARLLDEVKELKAESALAAAPKPCEHGCVDGKVLIAPASGNNYEAPCPIHGTKPTASEAQDLAEDRAVFGTKPEAPTELCKVCGQIQAHWHHADNVPAANCHPFTPTDATPKDEEPGR